MLRPIVLLIKSNVKMKTSASIGGIILTGGTEVLRSSGIERGPSLFEAGDEYPEPWRGL
jgi:hypothetical protein